MGLTHARKLLVSSETFNDVISEHKRRGGKRWHESEVIGLVRAISAVEDALESSAPRSPTRVVLRAARRCLEALIPDNEPSGGCRPTPPPARGRRVGKARK